ncbi:MAG TPA: DoxX family protein [Sphingomicrobium sp.]|nr:DoxX family protein [Sphingomicrobium sp.]
MRTIAILIARLIFAYVFAQAAVFKFMLVGMDSTAAEIAAAGFANPMLLAWIAAIFEIALAVAFLTGLFFRDAAVVAAVYVLFLGFSFHGPDRWSDNMMEFGFFIDHFVFIAGLLLAAVHGPGDTLVPGSKFTSRSS